MVGYTGLRENWTDILKGEIKPSGVYRNMGKCVTEVNPKGLG